MAARPSTSLRALAERWPIDRLRPRTQFKSQLLRIADAYEAKSSSSSSTTGEQAITASIERLLANDARQKYPRSSVMLNPPSAPNMFERLAQGITKAEDQAQAQHARWERWRARGVPETVLGWILYRP